jgi:competence protein ComEC
MYWFQQASLPGLLANLLAIPLVSMVIVPLILLSVLVLWLPGPLAVWLLTAADLATSWLFVWLQQLSTLQPMLFSATRMPGLGSTLLAMFGAVILFLPRGIPIRAAGLLLMLPMLLPPGRLSSSMTAQIDFLDVGQGLAVLVASPDYLMLYDTGPGNGIAGEGGWNLVRSSIAPMIKSTGRSPDMIVVSHADLDHAGGLAQLQIDYPDSQFLASLPAARIGVQDCQSPKAWLGGSLDFTVLHPSVGLPYLGNDSSCVISVKTSGLSLLLSGDISQVIERRLVSNYTLKHDIVTVPHHGSSTSSSQIFIHAVEPRLALISAASNNRFGFPRKDVMDRYAKAEVMTLNTADCGGIRLALESSGELQVKSARSTRAAIWRWPGSLSCP